MSHWPKVVLGAVLVLLIVLSLWLLLAVVVLGVIFLFWFLSGEGVSSESGAVVLEWLRVWLRVLVVETVTGSGRSSMVVSMLISLVASVLRFETVIESFC